MPETSTIHQVFTSETLGGGERVAAALCEEGLRRGRGVCAWVPGAGAAKERLDALGVPARLYDLRGLGDRGLSRFAALTSLALRLGGARGQVVHVHAPWVFGLMRPALRRPGLRSIVHFHLDPSEDLVNWCLTPPPDAVIGCSRSIAAFVGRLARENEKDVTIHAIPNAVDSLRFHPGSKTEARRVLGVDASVTLVLMVANIAEHKGQITTLRAVACLKSRGLHVQCLFAGEEREARGFLAQLEKLATDLGIADCVRFLGQRSDTPTLYRAADAVLLPSSQEGLPLSLLEAQACGTPVLASPLPGICEIVEHETTGWLLAPERHELYADVVELLVKQPELAARISDAARQHVLARHSWSAYFDAVFQAYAALRH